MKYIIAIMLALAVMVSGISVAAQTTTTCKSSGLKTSSAVVRAAPGKLCGVEIVTNGTNAATIIVYDHASSASGTVLFKGTVAGTDNYGGATFGFPVRAASGLYISVSGTEAAGIVYYDY
jgi:hypothetical protein